MSTLIAHVSDLHLLGRSPASMRDPRARFVSLGRALDPEARAARCARALAQAAAAGADHLVVTGDLTELGHADAFHEVARALSSSGFAPQDVTIVPGNHDRYGEPSAFEDALNGVLAPWAKNAARAPGKVVDLGTVRLLPLDVTIVQSVARSRGRFTRAMADALAHRIGSFARGHRVALVQHHPPVVRNPVADWFDGLVGAEFQRELLDDRVQILHGHLHEASAATFDGRRHVLLGAPAAVEDEAHAPRVMLYAVGDAGLTPVHAPAPAPAREAFAWGR